MSRPISAVPALGLLLGACVYQIDSAIPDGRSMFDPRLVGTWVAESDTVTIAASGAGGYQIEFRNDKGEALDLNGRIGRLGGRTLLEVAPRLAGEEKDAWPIARLPVFLIISDSQVVVHRLDVDAIRAAAASDPSALPHIKRGDDVILSAPTEQLVPALTAHLTRPGALEEGATWRRVVRKPPPGGLI